MRHFGWMLIATVWFVAGIRAETPTKEVVEKPNEPIPPEMVGKLRLTLDPGGHTDDIKKVLFTPDGKQLITASEDHSIRIWDLESGKTVRVLRFPRPPMEAVLSPDGRLLAVNSHYSEGGATYYVIYLIALAEGRIDTTLKGHTDRITALAFSHDGKRLASASVDSTLRIWNVTKGEAESQFESPTPVLGLAFSPDGDRLVQSRLEGFAIRDLTQNKIVPLAGGTLPRLAISPDNVAWSQDGKTIATCAEDGLRLWDADGKLRFHLLEKVRVQMAAFSPGSRHIFAAERAAERRTVIFDVRTGKTSVVRPPDGTYSFVWHGAYSPDGKFAATAYAGSFKVVGIWKTSDGSAIKKLGPRSWIDGGPNLQAGWSADGKTVSWRKIDKADTWKGPPTSFQPEELQFGPALEMGRLHSAVTKQGPLALKAIKDDTVQVLKDGKPLSEMKLPAPYHNVRKLTFVGKDRAAFSGDNYGFFLFDTITGKLVRRIPHPGWLLSLAPSPDGRFLLSLSEDQTLRIWDAREGKFLFALYVSGHDWIAWTTGGYYAASPGGEKLMGWVSDNGPSQLSSFYPAQRFKNQLYRPDVIKLVLEKGSVGAALKAANVETQDLEKILPPRGELRVLKQDGSKVEVSATATALSSGQPVTELHLLVDGRPAKLDGDKLPVQKIDPAQAKLARAAWTVALEPGTHKLSVRAVSKDAYSITDEIEVAVKSPTPRASTKHGTLHYVGIGVNHFENHPELKLVGAVPDVLAMKKCLQQACADRFAEVVPTVLTDDKATRGAVLQTLTDLQGKLKPSDVVIVHYSSHGEVDPEGGLYLLTTDTKRDDLKKTAISGSELRDKLGQYPSPVLLLLDACHSGKFPLRPATDPLSRLLADDSCGVAVMTAALAHQKAEDRKQGGVFTQALVAGLNGGAKPSEAAGRRLYVHQLFSYVFDNVTKETSNRQMPLYLPSGSVPPIVLKESE